MDETVVLRVRADPKPNHLVGFAETDSSVAAANSGGPNARIDPTDAFEVQTWAERVVSKQAVRFPSLPLDRGGKLR